MEEKEQLRERVRSLLCKLGIQRRLNSRDELMRGANAMSNEDSMNALEALARYHFDSYIEETEMIKMQRLLIRERMQHFREQSAERSPAEVRVNFDYSAIVWGDADSASGESE